MTGTQARTGGPGATVAAWAALDQAVGHLLGLQHSQGWWQGELETNVTMDAEDLLLREFLGVRTAEQTSAAARWIRSCHRPDGTWANFLGGEADLSTTVEAYLALRLARARHVYERGGQRLAPARAVRTAGLRRCAEWIIARQERDGCWGGIQPPWVYSLIALHLLGYGLDHPVISRGLAGLDRFTVWEESPDGPVRRLEACQSPVWDTVLAMIALADAGLPPDHH